MNIQTLLPHAFRASCLAAALAIAGCGGADSPPAPAVEGDVAAPSRIEDWPLPPTLPGSASPSLAATPDDKLLLGWINSQKGRRHIFQFSTWAPDWGRWMHAMTTIAVGNSMFVNWADIPHMAATPDGALWAHWLQKSGDAPYAYDVVLTRSRDGGANWAAPVMPHDDGTRTEHGFVSMWAQGDGALGLAWLDGRETGNAHGGHEGHDSPEGAQGAMTLRAAVFDATLQRSADAVIDARVCDCCQTAVAQTAKGPLLVYRGRSEDEVRDILATRHDGSAWSTPRPVHADGWTMPACPVNGPDVAAAGNAVVVAWYTEADGEPEVRLAASSDAGDAFAAVVTLDRGQPVLGRVAVALDARQAWVLWMREEGGRQSLWLSRRSHDLATEHERVEVAKVAGEGRGTGFPQLAVMGGVAHVVWTDVVAGQPNLKGVRLVGGG
ncbi:exo-alpha-sialidase [Luteimonas viscosa]|uniref:Exo-alpha-sialidase n=1 Tax=Luteimonas viscosa TaxID=1132694 RepID=A0A5D4XQQ9_9GAMM|nr:sialidase family protein [Luteimonas viscosa]TYT26394.1 exo-alpha-sialidase [Luteimonas viscosa]